MIKHNLSFINFILFCLIDKQGIDLNMTFRPQEDNLQCLCNSNVGL